MSEVIETIGKEEVAEQFRVSVTTARDKIMKLPNFPRPINPWGREKRVRKIDFETWLATQVCQQSL